jgi:uncharacterized protein YkwD
MKRFCYCFFVLLISGTVSSCIPLCADCDPFDDCSTCGGNSTFVESENNDSDEPKEESVVILGMVNEVREQGCKCGEEEMPPVAPLVWNKKLENAAQGHSDDMFQNGIFSHEGSNGSSPADRVTKAGYQWFFVGENIAFGYPNEQEVMKGWLNSPSHCKNIMNVDFKEIGVGRKEGYWTQKFATAKPSS